MRPDATGRRPVDRARRRRAHAALLPLAAPLAALLAGACVTRTSISYLPSAEQPRLELAQAQATLGQFVGVECERLRGAGRAEGSARLRLAQDATGDVTQADLAESSGDARVDGVMGAIAAQLHLPPAAADQRAAVVRASYRCAADGSVSATIERA